MADISIPILKQKIDGFDFDIALKYHPSGIKVNQIASWVGLGWNISGVGTITRSINGIADEEHNGILSTKRYYPPSLLDMNHCESEYYNPNNNPENFLFLTDVAEKVQDSESDTYFLNVGEISCQFIVKPDGKCETLPISNIIIEYVEGGTWKVKDEQGNIFIFDDYETTRVITRDNRKIGSIADKTAWYLTKVITARGQEIDYEYQTAGCTSSPIRNESICYYYKEPVNHYIPEDVKTITTDKIIYNTPVLKCISIPGCKVIFESEKVNHRLDQNIPTYPLKSIKIYNNNLEILKEYEPIYSYFESDNGLNVDKSVYKRLKLTGINIKNNKKLNIPEKKYSFSYYETIKLPATNSCAQDYWGFYNGAIGNDEPRNEFSLIPKEVFAEKGLTDKYQGAIRDPKFPEMMAWSLKEITYPSGGRSEFIYSSHDYFIEKGTEENNKVVQYYSNTFNNSNAVQNNIDQGVGFSTQDHEFVVNGKTGQITEAKFKIKLSPNTGGMMKHAIKLINLTTNTTCFSESYTNNNGYKTEYKTAFIISGNRYLLRMQSNTYISDEVELTYQYYTNESNTEYGTNKILGGLRINKIINYTSDQDNSPLFTE